MGKGLNKLPKSILIFYHFCKERGFFPTFRLMVDYLYYKTLNLGRFFRFQGKRFSYLCHYYNWTWNGERAVEVPIIWDFVKKYKGKRILEVGNVLSHYQSIKHEVVDKYEKADGVINADIISFNPHQKYDLIVSISTIEHIGWDKKPKKPAEIKEAIKNIKKILKKGGRAIITAPVGYNRVMDKLIDQKKLGFTEYYFLKRISKDNQWIQTSWEDIKDSEYNQPYNCANGVVIGIFKKS